MKVIINDDEKLNLILSFVGLCEAMFIIGWVSHKKSLLNYVKSEKGQKEIAKRLAQDNNVIT